MEKYYLTTPIYYVNARPHIGHVYTTVAADALARWERFLGKEVFFLTGTDEHGSKIAASADESGVTPKELADSMVQHYRDLWKILEVSLDRFIRTTEPEHEKIVQTTFLTLYRKGDIYPGTYQGYYCVSCENYLTPAEGKVCPDCGRTVNQISEPTYFFRLSRYQGALKEYFRNHPEFIQPPQIKDEINNMLGIPLPDLSLTRRCVWGVPLPAEIIEKETTVKSDPCLKHAGAGLSIYVWFDALLNYLSGVGGPDGNPYKKFWPPDVHIIGKDIIRFHHIIWPAILMALELPLPKKVFAHGWWLSGGEKMSKSRGNVVEPFEFCQRYGSESLRYFLLAEVPFGLDGDFTETSFKKRYNSDLANDLGNLIHRFKHLILTNSGGKVPEPGEGGPLAEKTLNIFPELIEKMENLDFYGFLEKVRQVVTSSNQYLDEQAPWRQGQNAKSTLYNLTEVSRILSLYLKPVLPKTVDLIRGQLGISDLPETKDAVRWGLTPAGATVSKTPPLFPRIK